MKKTSVNLNAQTILQIEAGKHEAVRDGGKLFILFHEEDGCTESEPKEVVEVATANEPAIATTTAEELQVPEDSKDWSEDLMIKMDVDELVDECQVLSIAIPKDGKRNNNKKIRTLILDHYKNGGTVIDDTNAVEVVAEEVKTEAPARRRRATAEPKKPELESIPSKEWSTLNEGDLVLAKLKGVEGQDDDKLWEAEVSGFKVPKGETKKSLHLFFTEDSTEDCLREGDELFEYQEGVV